MSVHLLTTSRVQDAIEACIRRSAATQENWCRAEDVAAEVHCSRSTLTRRLDAAGTTFTAERLKVKKRIAIRLLVSGESVAYAARQVALHPDHLTRLVRQETGLLPREIKDAGSIAEKLDRWSRDPLRSGTRPYFKRRDARRRLESKLESVLRRTPNSHDLQAWVERCRRKAHRPDFRRDPYRSYLVRRRRAEREEAEARLQQALSWISEKTSDSHSGDVETEDWLSPIGL